MIVNIRNFRIKRGALIMRTENNISIVKDTHEKYWAVPTCDIIKEVIKVGDVVYTYSTDSKFTVVSYEYNEHGEELYVCRSMRNPDSRKRYTYEASEIYKGE